VVTALEVETVVLGSEKQPFESEGLLETVNAIVPVYPFFGVTVMIEVADCPADTVILLPESVKALEVPVTASDSEPVEEA
jgi:hypothetical protein